jgi:hypothetical protein
MSREIQQREFSEMVPCGIVVGSCSGDPIEPKTSQMDKLLIDGDTREVMVPLLVEHYSLESGSVVASSRRISVIEGMIRYSKIMTSIIKRFTGSNVVPYPTVSSHETEYLPVHVDGHSRIRSFFSCSVEGLGIFIPPSVPFMVANRFIIALVYECSLTLGERDFTIGWEEWKGHARNCLRVGFIRGLRPLTPPFYHSEGGGLLVSSL